MYRAQALLAWARLTSTVESPLPVRVTFTRVSGSAHATDVNFDKPVSLVLNPSQRPSREMLRCSSSAGVFAIGRDPAIVLEIVGLGRP